MNSGRERSRSRRSGWKGTVARFATGIAPGRQRPPSAHRHAVLRVEPVDDAGADLDVEPDRPPDVAVRLLGPFEVLLEGLPVQSWGGRRIRTVFQYLLLHDRPIRREVLMDLMWPGHTYDSARNNLNVCLYGLRRVLGALGGADYVVYRDGAYGLNHDLRWSIDTARFTSRADRMRAAVGRGDATSAIRHGRAAVQEYRGPLLDGEPAVWCTEQRAVFAERYARTLQRVAELQVRTGDVAAAEQSAARLVGEEPCREAAHRLLMICFAERGEQDLVARQFRRCVERLREDLDVPPSAETVDLYRSLTAAR